MLCVRVVCSDRITNVIFQGASGVILLWIVLQCFRISTGKFALWWPVLLTNPVGF